MELRRKLLICPLIVLTVVFTIPSSSQISTFPYTENFDSVATPNLPFGWSSTQNRTVGINDFTTSTSTPQSLPNVVVSTNATIGQTLYSPLFDFHSEVPDRLTFYTRRTATHLARVVVEASTDSGATYPLQLGDSLTNTGSTNYVAYSIVLPGSLANRSGVKLRWRIIADVSGSQGTFRIDDITVTVQTSHDLALSALRFSPATPIEQDSVRAFAFVNNVGLQVASSFQVNFYNDLNNDSLPQPNEFIIAASNAVPLAVADSVELAASIGPFNAGDRLIIAQLVYQLDENITNDRKRSVLRVGYYQRSVVVNEIMYAPTNNEPEWVELYNTRSDSINIKDWLISDNNVATRRVISTTAILLPAHAFVVLTKDSAALIDVHPDIPSRIINIPLMPTLNNAGDAVVVYDARNAAMDSVSYLPGWGGNTSGKSLERIDPIDSSTAQSNWGTSRHPNRSTPGRRNSLTRKDFDITLDTLLISPPFPIRGDSVIVSARIRNAGFQAITSLLQSLFDDANGDSIPQPSEFVASIVQGNPLLPLDSVLISFVP
ncbi:MAG: hypothetical protein HW412_877, partial [Bacteroidetes bacterium]|nr:hypothetical protein [Bacteroidota bacterium]